jgi:iron complex transport system permease protein
VSRVQVAVVTGAALSAAAVLSLVVGSRPLAPTQVWAALVGSDADGPARAVVDARVARTVVGVLVGAALALAGAALQGLARNPLADPGILGLNAGAALAVVAGIHSFGLASPSAYVWCALAGAAGAAFVVHCLAALGPAGATPAKLALAGAAMTAGLTSVSSGLLLGSKQTMDVFRHWQVGSVAGRDWATVVDVVPFLLVGAVLVLASVPSLNALALGDDLARGLGRRLGRDRVLVALGVVLLCGAATALAGPIGFVGLVVPHAVRMLGGGDHRVLLPLSLAAGAALLVLADVVGRVVMPPTEVQVGVMTALLGTPVFVLLVRRGRLVSL